MGSEPEIRYVRSGGVAIAYPVLGDGDVDLVYVPDYVSNLVYAWEIPWSATSTSGGSGLGFVARGARELKGVPGEWQLYAARPEPGSA